MSNDFTFKIIEKTLSKYQLESMKEQYINAYINAHYEELPTLYEYTEYIDKYPPIDGDSYKKSNVKFVFNFKPF